MSSQRTKKRIKQQKYRSAKKSKFRGAVFYKQKGAGLFNGSLF